MFNNNRSRLTIYTNPDAIARTVNIWGQKLPKSLESVYLVVGTVTRGDGDSGLLLQLKKSGVYVQWINGLTSSLDERKVVAAINLEQRLAVEVGEWPQRNP